MSKNKINSKKKTLALIVLFAISALIFLNSQVKDVKADPQINIPVDPITNPYNLWHWHEDVQNGTEYVYEVTFIAQNKTTKEYILGTKFYFDFNITIFNATIQWHGPKPCFFSVINATELYYNESLGKTVAYPMSPKMIGGFQYNDTFDPMESKERVATSERIPLPFFLPLNGTKTINDDKNDLADIINASIFYAYYLHGMLDYGFPFMNLWNDILYPRTNTIRFENDSGYYCELEYYDNGTLKYADLYEELIWTDAQIGHPEGLAIVNMTFNRIFDPNPINEVQWGVEPGDIIYYGDNGKENDPTYLEDYINITNIINATEEDKKSLYGFSLLYDGNPYFTYQAVIGYWYIWDSISQQYEKEDDHLYGLATDYNPLFVFFDPDYGVQEVIIPNNTKAEDLQFFMSLWCTYRSAEEFSGVYSLSVKNEKSWYKIDGKLGSGAVAVSFLAWYDKISGILERFEFTNPNDGNWLKFFIKENHTLDSYNHITLNTKFLSNNLNATANITTIGNSDFIIGLLPGSPVNETLPYGTPLAYIDWLITDLLAITHFNMTIKLPTSLDLDNYNVQFWVWNMSEETQYDWTINNSYIVINYADNSITIIVPDNELHYIGETIIAISYTVKSSPLPPSGDDDDDGGGAEEPAAIPGFDLWVLFGVIGLVSLIAVLKKRKFVK